MVEAGERAERGLSEEEPAARNTRIPSASKGGTVSHDRGSPRAPSRRTLCAMLVAPNVREKWVDLALGPIA